MKKPEITRGKFGLLMTSYYGFHVDLKGLGIHVPVANFGKEEDALLFVFGGEMMDRLIDLHGSLESLTYSESDRDIVEAELENIKETLKKVGVTEL